MNLYIVGVIVGTIAVKAHVLFNRILRFSVFKKFSELFVNFTAKENSYFSGV